MPRVTICLPNLNNAAFLDERIDTIQAQTYADWELVVFDNFSDDGAWEILNRRATSEPRMRLHQAHRKGLYANWNNCLSVARGEFIYFATSDDTMAPTFLEEMVTALDAHPECGIGQCCLEIIDPSGRPYPFKWVHTGLFKAVQHLYFQPHLRRAPLDGYLHASLNTIYTSITRILIRRTVFDRTGPFPTQFGSAGDFAWGMLAGFTTDVVHVPRFLATWRHHPSQATLLLDQKGSVGTGRILAMVEHVVEKYRSSPADRPIPTDDLLWPAFREHVHLAYREARGSAKLGELLSAAKNHPLLAVRLITSRLIGKFGLHDTRAYVTKLLKRDRVDRLLIPL